MIPLHAIFAGFIFCMLIASIQVRGQVDVEWSIGEATLEEIDIDIAGQTTIFYSHNLGNATTSIEEVKLYVSGFVRQYDIGLVSMVNESTVDDVLTYGLTIDHSEITEFEDQPEYIVIENDNSTLYKGVISVATSVTRSLALDNGNDLEVTRRNTEFQFEFVLDNLEFELIGTLNEIAPTAIEETIDLNPQVTVCFCEADTFVCAAETTGTLVQNTYFEVCVIPSEGFVLGNFMLQITRDDDASISYTPISYGENGFEEDLLTEKDDLGTTVKFYIMAVSTLFTGLTDDFGVTAGGTAFLALEAPSGRLDLEEEVFISFDLQATLQPPTVQEEEEAGFFEAIFNDILGFIADIGEFFLSLFEPITDVVENILS